VDVLGRDYKEWVVGDERGVRLGISSVVKGLGFLRDKAEGENGKGSRSLEEELERFAVQKELDLYALMTASTDDEGEFRRELVVWALTPEALPAAKKFLSTESETLGLQDLTEDESGGLIAIEGPNRWRKAWQQRRVENSRKQVAPMLIKAFRRNQSRG
jgi:exopolyphosphatase